jgi:hypothetical protein
MPQAPPQPDFLPRAPETAACAASIEEDHSGETRPVLDGLARLAESHRCCILFVRHLSKRGTGRAIHRGLGSMELSGAVRTEFLAGSSPDAPSCPALLQVKSNLGGETKVAAAGA